MAEEPQPASVEAGSSEAAVGDVENPGLKAASKDDAKAAAALDKLDSHGGDDDGKGPSAADASKLSSAMSNLKVGSGADGAKTSEASDAAAAKKKIKIDAKDVALIVEHCDLRKDKATELLRNNEGDLMKALTAYVTSAA